MPHEIHDPKKITIALAFSDATEFKALVARQGFSMKKVISELVKKYNKDSQERLTKEILEEVGE